MLNFNNEVQVPLERCTKLEGFGDLSATVHTEKSANGEGSILLGSSINNRNMVIDFDVDMDIADKMQRYFKPKMQHTLYMFGRKINFVVVNSELIHDMSLSIDPTLSLALYAPDPYFYDVSDFSQNIAGIQPAFGFPWTATIKKGITFGYSIFSDKTIFTNNGDKPVGFKLIVKANGNVENFKFENLRNGKYIQVNTTLKNGDTLEISSVAGTGNKYIKKNDINIYKDIDRLSGFFYLDVGDNFLQYSADVGTTSMDIWLYYSPAYANGGVK